MDDPIGEMLEHEAFRGLWRSRCLEPDGRITGGWSVSFVHDGQYYDAPYQDNAWDACTDVLNVLANADALNVLTKKR